MHIWAPPRWTRALTCLAGTALLAGFAAVPTPARTGNTVPSKPVIVELFTSEGCSSCPPADAVLSELVREQPIRGAQIIALGEHVDYWNHGGWADPFSSHAFSVRQSDYSNHFRLDTVYTPQMIVDGRAEFVGSDRDQALQSIARAARAPKATVEMTRLPSSENMASFQVHVSHLPAVSAGDAAAVVLAITEDGLSSDVNGGENGGRTLAHTAVVREMRLLGTADKSNANFTVHAMLASGWHRENLRAVAFVQERGSRHILGAAVAGMM